MLVQRRRRWTGIKSTLVQRLVFAGPKLKHTDTKLSGDNLLLIRPYGILNIKYHSEVIMNNIRLFATLQYHIISIFILLYFLSEIVLALMTFS